MSLWTVKVSRRIELGEAERLWSACTEAIRSQVPEATWKTCFHSTSALSLSDHALVVAAPSSLVKERLERRWSSLLSATLAELGAGGVAVEVTVRPDVPVNELFPADAQVQPLEEIAAVTGWTPAARPGPGSPGPARGPLLNPRYTFDSFVTGASNRFAHAAALSVAETPARSWNPLFIYGVAGLGKTHLLHAISHYVGENYPAHTVRYVSTEAYLNDFVDAIRSNSTGQFKRKYRQVDVLLVDDIQFMEGKEGLQEEFFHNFNELHGANKQIVISSDRPPKAIATLHDRLRTRFEWGLITDVTPPDFETRLAILRKKADREPAAIPPEILELIASHVTNNIRELEGALIRVSAFASLTQEPLTMDLATEVLGDVPLRQPSSRHHPQGDPRGDVVDVRVLRRGAARQEQASTTGHRPPGGHVRVSGADRPQLPRHRPGVRGPGPHHRHPCRGEGPCPDG